MRILLVEDDQMIGEGVVDGLKAEGYAVDWVQDGNSALIALRTTPFSLVILDLGLPGKDGISVLQEVRSRRIHTPVLVTTARDTVSDRVKGLDAGADDYVVKPFSPRELIARIRAVLRRGGTEAEKTVTCGPLTINEARFSAKVQGEPVKLGVIEFKMLLVLASSPGRVYSRAQLLSRVWDDSTELDERTVDVHILRLRKQLAGTAAASLVETVRGLGYRANDAV